MSGPASQPHPQPGGTAAPAPDPVTEATSLVDLLNQLVLPAEPVPVSMVPQTAGWWVLGALLMCLLAGLALRLWRLHRANAYRRAALAELQGAADDAAVAAILRRTALAAWPRAEVAGLTGPDWIAFLQTHGPFPAEQGAALTRAAYAPGQGRSSTLAEAARHWIRQHKGAA